MRDPRGHEHERRRVRAYAHETFHCTKALEPFTCGPALKYQVKEGQVVVRVVPGFLLAEGEVEILLEGLTLSVEFAEVVEDGGGRPHGQAAALEVRVDDFVDPAAKVDAGEAAEETRVDDVIHIIIMVTPRLVMRGIANRRGVEDETGGAREVIAAAEAEGLRAFA